MSFTFSFFYGPSPLFRRVLFRSLQFKKWVGCFVAIFFNKKGFSLHPLRQKIEKAPTFSGTIFAALLIPASRAFWHGFRSTFHKSTHLFWHGFRSTSYTRIPSFLARFSQSFTSNFKHASHLFAILYRWGKRQVFISSDSMLCLSLSSQAFLRLPYHKKYFIVIECFSFRDGMRDFQSTWLL